MFLDRFLISSSSSSRIRYSIVDIVPLSLQYRHFWHHPSCRIIRTKRSFPSVSSSSFSSSADNGGGGDGGGDGGGGGGAAVTIHPGPSSIKTRYGSLHRPSPSIMSLAGLRCTPVWTKWEESEELEADDGSYYESRKRTKIAFGDWRITRIVERVENYTSSLRNEYFQAMMNGTLVSDYHPHSSSSSSNNNHDEKLSTLESKGHKLHHGGRWDWYSYMKQGQRVVTPQGSNETFEQLFPKTCQLMDSLREDHDLFEGTPFGYAFFSILHGQTSIEPHTSPTNLRLRVHLPLWVPSSSPSSSSSSSFMDSDLEDDDTITDAATFQKPFPCGIRVGPITRQYEVGRAIVFDDSYDHEVWNDTTESRVVFLLDIWHPDVTKSERQDIIQTFQHAKDQGWISSPS
jgi:hypothetical protein